ncbi:MAG: hypothetical protein DMF93_20190 [Acidobacteria bacterium]|nr:MAG: hypothetical protein DMF93_20190 [Acidobacteriota bacterium]
MERLFLIRLSRSRRHRREHPFSTVLLQRVNALIIVTISVLGAAINFSQRTGGSRPLIGSASQ